MNTNENMQTTEPVKAEAMVSVPFSTAVLMASSLTFAVRSAANKLTQCEGEERQEQFAELEFYREQLDVLCAALGAACGPVAVAEAAAVGAKDLRNMPEFLALWDVRMMAKVALEGGNEDRVRHALAAAWSALDQLLVTLNRGE
jgi:phage FluMu protein gp41